MVRESGSTEMVAVDVDVMVYSVCDSEEDVDEERGERRSRFVFA